MFFGFALGTPLPSLWFGHTQQSNGQRLPKSHDKDDNPDPANTLALTLRHSLRTRAHGSARLESLRTIDSSERPALSRPAVPRLATACWILGRTRIRCMSPLIH